MNNDKLIFTIELSQDTVKEITSILYVSNHLSPVISSDKIGTIEDFVKGSVVWRLKDIESIKHIADVSGLLEQTKFNYEIKNNFKEIAKSKNMSQSRLAEITGINRTNINNIFNNKFQPRIDFFLRIWLALDRPPIEDCFIFKND